MPSETVTFREGTVFTIIARDVPTNERYTWRILGGSASYGTDYSLSLGASGSVTNPQPGFRFNVTFNSDAVVDPGEYFDLEVIEVEDGVTTVFNYRVIIEDTTVPSGGAMAFSPSSIEVPEGAVVPFSLTWKDFTQGAVYSVSSVSGSAMAGADFTAFNATGTAINQGYSYFTIQTTDDKLDEGPESFTVTATPGRGTGATMTVTILDNDKLRCLLDLDHDGVGSVTEIGLSQIAQLKTDLLKSMELIDAEEQRIATQLSLLQTEQGLVQKEAYLQLVNSLAGLVTAGVGNTAVAWLSALTPGVQAIADAIATGDFASDGQVVNAMRSLIAGVKQSLAESSALIPVLGLLEQSYESFETAAELNANIASILREMAKLKDRQAQNAAETAKLQQDMAALNACLIKSGAISAEDVDLPGARAILADNVDASSLAITLTGSATTAGFGLPAGMTISVGTGAADVFTGVGSSVYSAAAGAGDDVVRVGGGAAYVDGGAGRDSIIVLDATGAAVSLANIQKVDLPPGGAGAMVSLFLKSGGYIAGKDVEAYVFKDGYGRVSNGQWQITGFDARVSSAAANILRDAQLADPAKLVDVAAAGNSASAISAYVDGLVRTAAATSSVATLSYQFFTGKIPSAAGMDFLVAVNGPNANNLNSAYYQSFNLENRYINFAVNLGREGEGKAKFQAEYGSLSLAEATKKAYGVIFGAAPTDAKVALLLSGGRDLYFDAYGKDGLNGLGTKAAMVGWLLAEAVKADVGMYARANDAFLTDLADGATFAIDLVGVYGKPEFNYTSV